MDKIVELNERQRTVYVRLIGFVTNSGTLGCFSTAEDYSIEKENQLFDREHYRKNGNFFLAEKKITFPEITVDLTKEALKSLEEEEQETMAKYSRDMSVIQQKRESLLALEHNPEGEG